MEFSNLFFFFLKKGKSIKKSWKKKTSSYTFTLLLFFEKKKKEKKVEKRKRRKKIHHPLAPSAVNHLHPLCLRDHSPSSSPIRKPEKARHANVIVHSPCQLPVWFLAIPICPTQHSLENEAFLNSSIHESIIGWVASSLINYLIPPMSKQPFANNLAYESASILLQNIHWPAKKNQKIKENRGFLKPLGVVPSHLDFPLSFHTAKLLQR